jgi:hypothetical protein
MEMKTVDDTKCVSCKKMFKFEYEATPLVGMGVTPGVGVSTMVGVKFVCHCPDGNTVPVLGRVTKLWEKDEKRKWVEAKAHFSDF